MRKLLLTGLLLGGACTTRTVEAPVPAPAPVTTAPVSVGPRAAIDAFLAAIKAGDLQALSLAWGDRDGAIRDSKVLSREDVEKREVILTRCFKHDRYRVLSEQAAVDNERVFQVELTRGTLTRVSDFFTAHGADRWYVRSADMAAVKDLCAAK